MKTEPLEDATKEELMMELYPIMVTQAPLGIPDGAKWIAVPNCFVKPIAVRRFSNEHRIGWGATPDEALDDLLGRNSDRIYDSPFRGYLHKQERRLRKIFFKSRIV